MDSLSYLLSVGLRASVPHRLLSRGFCSLQFGPLLGRFTMWQLPSPRESDLPGRGGGWGRKRVARTELQSFYNLIRDVICRHLCHMLFVSHRPILVERGRDHPGCNIMGWESLGAILETDCLPMTISRGAWTQVQTLLLTSPPSILASL